MTRRSFPITASLVLGSSLLGCLSLPTVEEARSVSLEDEWRLGEVLDAELAHRLPVHEDADAQRLLSELAGPLAAATALGERSWHFVLLDEPQPYTLHLPGGRVFVTSGLVRACEDAADFAGLLAHEIAHAGQRHGLQLIARAHGPHLTLTLSRGENRAVRQDLAANVAAGGSFVRHGAEAERQADGEAMRLLQRTGLPPRAALEARLELLERERPAGLKRSRYFTCHPMGRDDGRAVDPESPSGNDSARANANERFRSLSARLQG
jgi:predicted Zn-dependent protease